VGTQIASKQCWWVVQALRSHSRRRLANSSDEMSPCVSRSRTSSVTDRRLILSSQPRCTTRKILTSFVVRILLWRCWQQKWLDLSKGQVRRQTIYYLHSKTGSVASCYKFHRHSICLRPLNNVVLFTTITCRFNVRPYFLQTSLQLSSVTSSVSDGPLTQFTVKPSFAMQAIAWG